MNKFKSTSSFRLSETVYETFQYLIMLHVRLGWRTRAHHDEVVIGSLSSSYHQLPRSICSIFLCTPPQPVCVIRINHWLYSVDSDFCFSVLLLDNTGERIMAKYFQPPHHASSASSAPGLQATLPQLTSTNPFPNLKDQLVFEKGVFNKTRKAAGDIMLYESHLLLWKPMADATFYVVGPADENPLMLSSLLNAITESVSGLLRGNVDKRTILENLDLVTLAVDECVDDGYVLLIHFKVYYSHSNELVFFRIILETDSAAIISRVSRPRPDVTDLQINEQTIMNAYSTLRDKYVPSYLVMLNADTDLSFLFPEGLHAKFCKPEMFLQRFDIL